MKRVDRRFGRLELLSWLNDTLSTDYRKVEEVGDGVAYLQLLDAVLPGRVPLERAHFNCRSKDDRERNLQLLRHAFKRAQISREVEVTALASLSFRHNNDMLQWFFTFIQLNFPSIATHYPAEERRARVIELQRERVLRKASHRSRSPMVMRAPRFWDATTAARSPGHHQRLTPTPAPVSDAPGPSPDDKLAPLLERYGGADAVCRELEADLAARRRRLALLERRMGEAVHARDVSLGALEAMLAACAEWERHPPFGLESAAVALVLTTARAIATAPLDGGGGGGGAVL